LKQVKGIAESQSLGMAITVTQFSIISVKRKAKPYMLSDSDGLADRQTLRRELLVI
jgi:hypothetical protein